MSDFEYTGSKVLLQTKGLLFFAFFAGGLLYAIPKGTPLLGVILALVIGTIISINVYRRTDNAVKLIFVLTFFVAGLTRIIPLPFGLGIDGLLLLAWLALLLKGKSEGWKNASNFATLAFLGWGAFCILEIMNPLSPSLLAWFYAVRGLSLQQALLIPLFFILFKKQSDYAYFFKVWFILSIILGLYAAKQFWIGVFGFEQRWLDAGGAVTHVLWGKFTRMFSFLSDANQFGNAQAHTAIVATIIALGKHSKKWRVAAVITALVCYYGMIISGTRGAIIVPGVGFIVYMIINRNIKMILLGVVVGGISFHLLANTHILHGVEAVRRMRTAFNATDDASFNVRLENRRILDNYMHDKPFGGGIGSAGVWGQRFSPDSFLAHFETDGHYVRIYAETGQIGLTIYLLLFVGLLIKMAWITWNLKDIKLKNICAAFTGGFAAIMAANYSAAVIIGLPTAAVVCFHVAYVIMAKKWDAEKQEANV